MTPRRWRDRRRRWYWHPVPRTLARVALLAALAWLAWTVAGFVADGVVEGAQGAPVTCLSPITGAGLKVSGRNVLTGDAVVSARGTSRAVTVTIDTWRAGHREYRDTASATAVPGDPLHIVTREQLPASWHGTTLRVRYTVKAACGTVTRVRTIVTPVHVAA